MTKDSRLPYGVVVTHPVMTLQFSIRDLSVISALINFLGGKGEYKDNVDYRFTVATSLLGENLHFIIDEGRLVIQILGHDELGSAELFEVKFSASEKATLATALVDALDEL